MTPFEEFESGTIPHTKAFRHGNVLIAMPNYRGPSPPTEKEQARLNWISTLFLARAEQYHGSLMAVAASIRLDYNAYFVWYLVDEESGRVVEL